MRFSRFERKIVVALLAVGFAPLVAALLLGRGAVREAYEVGVNNRIRRELESSLRLYTDHLRVLRDNADLSKELVEADPELGLRVAEHDLPGARARAVALMGSHPNVVRIQVAAAGTPALDVDRRPAEDDTWRLLELEGALAGAPGTSLTVTTATPWAPFHAHHRAAEIVKVYDALEAETAYVTTTYLGVFIILLFAVIVAAVAVGIVLSRRVTRRVALLAQATTRVGAGDLSVELPVETGDEIADLTAAFNTMVRDLRESQTRIEYLQRIGAWQQFARRLAHEIKNPLTPIQLAVQEMQTSYRGDDTAYRTKLDDARTIVEEEIATLRRLVGEFSAFAKLPKAELQEADLGAFVGDLERTVDAMLEDEAHRGGAAPSVEVVYQPTSEPIPVRIDPMMLKRCVDNLTRNAVEACRGRSDGRVVVRARRQGKRAILEVLDSGPGIAPEDRERVFDPYFTTKTDGTGLGLPIVKKVVLEHAGDIACETSELGGACFRITLSIAS